MGGSQPGQDPQIFRFEFREGSSAVRLLQLTGPSRLFNETSEADGSNEAEAEEEAELRISDLELSELGKRVAASYEAAIGGLPVVAKLTKEPDGCRPGELKRWGELGGICEVAAAGSPDRALLREVFFNRVGSPGLSHKFRHDSLTLLLELIDKTAPHGINVDHSILAGVVYFGATAAGEDNNEVVHLEIRRS